MAPNFSTRLLFVGVGLLLALAAQRPVVAQDRPPKLDREAFAREKEKMAEEARELAEEVMPSVELLRKNGDWKLPWQFPQGIVFTRRSNVHSGTVFDLPDIDTRTLSGEYWRDEKRYWESQGMRYMSGGKNPEQAKASMTAFEKYIKEGWEVGMGRTLHSVAVRADRASAKRHLTLEMRKENPFFRKEDGGRRLLALYPEFTDQKLRDEMLQALALEQRNVKMYYFRTNKPEAVSKIEAAIRLREKLVKEREGGAGMVTERLEKDWDKLRSGATDWETLEDRGVWLALDQAQVRWSIVVVHVLRVPPDFPMKNLTAEEAKALESRLNTREKAMVELERTFAEAEIKNWKKALDEAVADVKVQQKIGASSTQQVAAANYVEKLLARQEACWEVNQSAAYKVRLLDKGTNSHVISTRQAGQFGVALDRWEVGIEPAILHTAMIRNGSAIVEIEVMSTFPEEQVNKDLEFFLKVMHENTLKYRE